MAKTAVVTGGASGIGRKTAELLSSKGWKVWVFDLNAPSEVDDGIHYAHCDVRDAASIREAFAQVGQESGAVDALICCAGVTRIGMLDSMPAEDADLMLDVNLKGPWLCVREALPLLRVNGDVSDPSRVVIIGSISGLRPKVAGGFYGATKAAIHVIAQVFAVELAPMGVTVNVVSPGPTNTGMQDATKSKGVNVEGFKPTGPSPLGRIAEPQDQANAIAFLLSDEARYINGAVLPVDGGARAAYDNR